VKIKNLFSQFMGQGVAIDLGTANTVVATTLDSQIISFPSLVTLDTNTNQVVAVGHAAADLVGRTPAHLKTIRPLQDGVIVEFDAAEALLQTALHTVLDGKPGLVKPKIVIGVPSLVTEVEMMALVDAAVSAGAGKVYVVEEPVAAALGLEVDITAANAKLIVDIGGGTTDIMVLAANRVLVDTTIKVAGDELDKAIQEYVRFKYNLHISERMAESIKQQHGCVTPSGKMQEFTALGQDITNNLPKSVKMHAGELSEAILKVLQQLSAQINLALTKCPPEVLQDITKTGIFLAGGGALLPGLDKYLQQTTGLKVNLHHNSLQAVVLGNLYLLKHPNLLSKLIKQHAAYI
jgi:rod shape-determining protein MreB